MATIARDASWVFESIGLSEEPESKRQKISIPDTLVFKRDDASGRLSLSAWLQTGKSGTIVRKPAAEFMGNVRRWRDKLVGTVPAGQQQAVAQAFGFDGVGQGVPPAGLDNLLADLESGVLEGITMLQAKVKLGAKPAGHFEVEVNTDPSGKHTLKAKIAQAEVITPQAAATLRLLRDDLLAFAKRVLTVTENTRRVKVQAATLEFVADSAAQPGLYLVGGYGIRSTASEGERLPARPATGGLSIPQPSSYDPNQSAHATALPSPSADIETVYLDAGLSSAGATGMGMAGMGGMHTFTGAPFLVDPAMAAMLHAQAAAQAQAQGQYAGGRSAGPQFVPIYPGMAAYGYGGPIGLASPMDAGGPFFPQAQAQAAGQDAGVGRSGSPPRIGPASSPRGNAAKTSPNTRGRSSSPPGPARRTSIYTGNPAAAGGGGAAGSSLGSPQQGPGPSLAAGGGGQGSWAVKTSAGAGMDDEVRALKRRVAELAEELYRTRASQPGSAQQASALAARGEPEEVAALRKAGRFNYAEEPVPSASEGREALEEVVRRLQLRWREAVELAETVRSSYAKEAAEAVGKLVEEHRRELLEVKSAFESMEENVASTNARLNAAGLELTSASRREQAALDRASRLVSENRRLAGELQGAMHAARTGTAGGGPYIPSPLPSPAVPHGLPRRPSFSRSNVGRAGAELLGMSNGVGPAISFGDDSIGTGGAAADSNSSTLAATQSALLTLQTQVRQLQMELETTRDNLNVETASRSELSQANAKLLEEFRMERRRLKAQVAQLEDAGKGRMSSVLMASATRPGTAASGVIAAASSAAGVNELLSKVRETEALQTTLAACKVELAEAREALESVASGKAEAVRALDGLAPVRVALEAEASALRQEVLVLRNSAGSGSSSDAFAATERAAAARANADATLAKSDLRALREQYERVRADAAKLSEAMSSMRTSRSAEVESVREAERAERDRALRELSSSREDSLNSALEAVQADANKRFVATSSKLQGEVMTLSNKLQAAAGEAAQLRSALARAKEEAGAAAARPRADSIVSPDRDPDVLRAALDVAQGQAQALANELMATREAAQRQAFDFTKSANAKFTEMQEAHAEELAAARREADSALSARVSQTAAAAAATASLELADARRRAAARWESLSMAAEDDRAHLLAGGDARVRSVLSALDTQVNARLVSAVSESVAAARAEWDASASAAMSAMVGKQQNAAEMAEAAAAAARRELGAHLGMQLQQLEHALSMERTGHMHTLQTLAAKESAVASLLTDIRVQATQASEAQAYAVASAEAAAVESMQKQMAARLAESEARAVSELKVEIARWEGLLTSAEAAARTATETAIAATEKRLKDAHRAALQGMETEQKGALEKAVSEAMETVSSFSVENSKLVAMMQGEADKARNELAARHSAEVQMLQGHIAELSSALQSTHQAIAQAQESSRAEMGSLAVESNRRVMELQESLELARRDVAQAEAHLTSVRAASRAELDAVRAKAAQEVSMAGAASEAIAKGSGERALAAAKEQWREETARAVEAAAASARAQFDAELGQLAFSADTHMASQADSFRQAEAGFNARLQAVQQGQAEEMGRLRIALQEARLSADAERAGAAAALEATARSSEARIQELLATTAEAATGQLRESEAAWAHEREAAVRAAVDTVRAELHVHLEAERAEFRHASNQAAEVMLAEANALINAARSEAARDKAAALEAQRAELQAAMELGLSRANQDVSIMMAERDAAAANAEARHNANMGEASQYVAMLQEALQQAQAAAMKAVEDGHAAVREAEARAGAGADSHLREVEKVWADRVAVLQSDNERAAGIIAGLLHEADEASRRAAEGMATLSSTRDMHKLALAELVETHEAETAALRADLDKRLEEARARASADVAAAAAKAASDFASEREALLADRSALETAFAQERLTIMGMAQAQEGAAIAAVDELRGRFSVMQHEELNRLRLEAQNDIDGLRAAHATELSALQAKLSEAETAVIVSRKDAEERGVDAVMRVREEANAAAEARIASLEEEVGKELSAAARAASEATAAAVAAMEASYAQDMERLRNEFAGKMDGAARALAATESFAQQQMGALRSAYESEMVALRDSSVPLQVVQELRDKMESQAVAALTSAVDEAVNAARSEAEQLNAVLRQRIEEQDADRKALSGQLDMLQDAVTAQMSASAEQVTAANERAAIAEMTSEDLRSLAVLRSADGGNSVANAAAMAAAEVWMHARLTEVQASMEEELRTRMAEMQGAAQAQADMFSSAREALLSDKSFLETQMSALHAATSEALAERDSRIAALTVTAEALAREAEYVRGQAMEELKGAMRAAFEGEKLMVETRATEAITTAVHEAVAAGELAKAAALAEMRRAYEDRFREFEEEARNLQAALISSMEAKHAQEMESAARAALADRDVSLNMLLADRGRSLEDAQRVAQAMLDGAQAEHAAAMATMRAQHHEERSELIEAHREELTSALAAAKMEMQRLLGELDASWREKSAEMLARAAEEQMKALAALQIAYQEKLEAAAASHERSLLHAEDMRLMDLESALAGVQSAIAQTRAEGEADKIAALGAFNAEWASRMQSRVEELLEERDKELASVRSQYQAQLDETVAKLEAQREAALAAFAAEFAAERERLVSEMERAVAEATIRERSAGEAALARALALAREEREAALAEQAAALAEERARAIDAVRVQATQEQEEAMDALRSESEKLLSSIEGAMTRLRDERDIAQEDYAVASEGLAAERRLTAELEETVKGLRRAGVVARLHQFIIVARFAQVLESTKIAMSRAHAAQVAQLKAEAEARLAAANQRTKLERGKFRILVKMRAVLTETLTTFKRDQLLSHRTKSTTLAQELATLSEEKAAISKQASFHSSQVAEVEGTVRAIEREMAELSKQSVIDPDGTVNVALTRKKKRLDRDMDAALVKISDRKTAQGESEKKAAALEDERFKKEEELKSVEAGLVTTLVSQQRAIMSVLTSQPLPAEELALSRHEARELGLSDPDADEDLGPGGGGDEVIEAQEHMGTAEAKEDSHDQGMGMAYNMHGQDMGQMGMGQGQGYGNSEEGKMMDPGQQQAMMMSNQAAYAQAAQQLMQLQQMSAAGQLGQQGQAMMQHLQMQMNAAMQGQMGMGGMGMGFAHDQATAGMGQDAGRSTSPGKVALYWGGAGQGQSVEGTQGSELRPLTPAGPGAKSASARGVPSTNAATAAPTLPKSHGAKASAGRRK